ncbi:MAG TPA: zf-TFIIB domain-containing protein [Devosia sp.]
MKCPIDNVDLVMSERHGIEIDYCPQCRGVWLDRGELDKIIDRATPPAPAAHAPEPRHEERRPDPRYEGRDYRDDDYRRKPYKKRESFLGELFDF